MTATTATIQEILKTLYDQDSIPELAYKRSALLGMMKKTTNFEGYNAQVSNRFAGTGGGSASFTDAQGNVFGASYSRFLITHATDYSLLRIETLAARQARSSRGALVKAVKAEGDAAFYTMARSMSRTVWGNGGGARGVIASGGGTDTLTLVSPEDIVNFEVGMVVGSSLTDGTSGAYITGNEQRITAVDEDAGTITAAGNWDATDFANGNSLFRQGDFGAMATGVAGWVPDTAPTSGDNFFGLDRSVHPTRLAGIRFVAPASAGSIERALIDATARAARSGAQPTHAFVHPTVFGTLVKELGSKATYERMAGQGMNGKSASFGFAGLVLHSVAGGTMTVHSDADCPVGRAYMLTLKDWCFMGLGELPGFIDDDGNGDWLRVHNADAMEARIGYYGNICCEAPGHQLVCDLSALL
jgi:hypothetical protein